MMRALRIAALFVTAFALAGCGGAEEAATGDGAKIVPASAPVFISVDSDLSSSQWQTVDDLLRKFPARPQVLSWLRSTLREENLDYEQDVKPALGEEIDLVWIDFADGGRNVVGLTQPKDEEAFRRLVAKSDASGDDVVLREFRGWTIFAQSEEAIERFRDAAVRPGDKLADEGVFKDALAELPDSALVKAYASGESLTQLLGRVFGGFGGGWRALPSDQRSEFIAAALAAEGDGLRLVGAQRAATEPKTKPTVFGSKLIDDVPGDAVAFLTFRGKDSFSTQARLSPLYRKSLKQFERELGGVPLEQLFAIFDEEVALYVRPGTPFPEVTMLVAVDGEPAESKAFKNVDTVMKVITQFRAAQPCHAPTVEDGVTVACVAFDKIEVRYAGFDGKVVVTTGQSPVTELRAAGGKLPDADAFKGSREAADVPDETAGFLWLDVAKAVPMITGLARAADNPLPAQVRANLAPLTSFVAWADAEGRTTSFSAFAEID